MMKQTEKGRISAIPLLFTLCVAAFSVLSLSCKSDNPALSRAKTTSRLFSKQKIIRIACASSWQKNDSLQFEGISLACKEINEAGGVDGAKIELIKADDHLDEKEGLFTAYDIAMRPDITAVIGHSTSGIALQASRVYQYYGLLTFSPMATARKLTSQGFPYMFRNIPKATVFASSAANLCKQKGWNRILIYYIDTPYGEDLANAFEFACTKSDIYIAERESYSSFDEEKQFSTMAKWWDSNFTYDAIFVAGSMPQLRTVIKSIRDSGIEEPIVGADSFAYPGLEEWIATNNVRDIYAVTSFDRDSQNPDYLSFKEQFRSVYGKDPDQEAVQGYEALKVLAAAIGKSHSVKATDIAATLRENIWSGIIGKYRFNGQGDIIGTNMFIVDFNVFCDKALEERRKTEESAARIERAMKAEEAAKAAERAERLRREQEAAAEAELARKAALEAEEVPSL